MKWVYSIAFVGDRFLMVFNPKRQGWEMPGGRMEADEIPEQAAVREFEEEAGCVFRPYAIKLRRDGAVLVGEANCAEAKGEMAWELFSELPSLLSFGEDEYTEVLAWAREQKRRHDTRQ